jgi:hypothetical protein
MGVGQYIIRTRPDLVIKDAHLRVPKPCSVSGPGDWSLARQSTVPVLLVQSRQWPALPGIVLTIDPLHEGRPAVRDAAIVAMGMAMQNALGTNPASVLHFASGSPVRRIVDFVAENRASVLVMGIASCPSLLPSPAADVALQVLEQVDCDMLVLDRSDLRAGAS